MGFTGDQTSTFWKKKLFRFSKIFLKIFFSDKYYRRKVDWLLSRSTRSSCTRGTRGTLVLYCVHGTPGTVCLPYKNPEVEVYLLWQYCRQNSNFFLVPQRNLNFMEQECIYTRIVIVGKAFRRQLDFQELDLFSGKKKKNPILSIFL